MATRGVKFSLLINDNATGLGERSFSFRVS